MQRNIIHIGYHKTATNWFQRIYYPNVKNFQYIHRKKVRRAFLKDSAFNFNVQKALCELKTPFSDPVIICEEELSGNIHSGGLYGYLSKEVISRLKLTLPYSRIIIFIRNQPDMIASVYKQYIREGGTFTAKRYLFPRQYLSPHGFNPPKVPLFSFDHFEYYPLIVTYEAFFGRENVHVFPYEEFKQNISDFIQRFGHRFDFKVDESRITFDKINISYNRLILNMAKLLNLLTYQEVMDKRYLFHIPLLYRYRGQLLKFFNKFNLIGSGKGPSEILGKDTVAYIEKRYRETNRRLADEYDLDLISFRYPL